MVSKYVFAAKPGPAVAHPGPALQTRRERSRPGERRARPDSEQRNFWLSGSVFHPRIRIPALSARMLLSSHEDVPKAGIPGRAFPLGLPSPSRRCPFLGDNFVEHTQTWWHFQGLPNLLGHSRVGWQHHRAAFPLKNGVDVRQPWLETQRITEKNYL